MEEPLREAFQLLAHCAAAALPPTSALATFAALRFLQLVDERMRDDVGALGDRALGGLLAGLEVSSLALPLTSLPVTPTPTLNRTPTLTLRLT